VTDIKYNTLEDYLWSSQWEITREIIKTIPNSLTKTKSNSFMDTENLDVISIDDILWGSTPIITWGIPEVDNLFGASHKGKYEIFYWNAGSWKTSYLFQRAVANANIWVKTCFVSLEMNRKDLISQYALKAAWIKTNSIGTKIEPTPAQRTIIGDFLKEISVIDIKSYWKNPSVQWYKDLLNDLHEQGYQLIIIDNLWMIGRSDTNDEMSLFATISEITRIACNWLWINVIMTHHSKKASEWGTWARWTSAFRGTSKLVDDVDSMVQIVRVFDETWGSQSILQLEKDRVWWWAGKSIPLVFNKGKFSADIFI